MNKRFVVILLLVTICGLLLLGGVIYLSNRNIADQQNAAEQDRETIQPNKDSSEPDKTPPDNSKKTPGVYIEHSPDIIAKTSGRKVLFFHAPWCPQCRMIESDIKAQPELPENTTIIKVDYDSNQALRQKYGITLQTTFVLVDDEGNLEKKYVAYNEPNFQSVKDNLLD